MAGLLDIDNIVRLLNPIPRSSSSRRPVGLSKFVPAFYRRPMILALCPRLPKLAVVSSLAALPFLLTAPLRSNEATDFRGLSIEVEFYTVTTFKKAGDPVKTTVPERRELRFYIGTKGTVFQYSNVWSKKYTYMAVMPLGHAAAAGLGSQMIAYAVINGNITKLVKQVHGIEEQTIAVDPGSDKCRFSIASQPDSSGKIVSIDPISHKEYEQISRTLLSYTCTVKNGNVFSTDNLDQR